VTAAAQISKPTSRRRFTPCRFRGNRLYGRFGNLCCQAFLASDRRPFATPSSTWGGHEELRPSRPGSFRHEKDRTYPRFAQQGRFTRRPCCPWFSRFIVFAPCCVSVTHGQGLIHIVAELGWPSAYPAPSSRVSTTLYARLIDDPLGSGNVLTMITA